MESIRHPGAENSPPEAAKIRPMTLADLDQVVAIERLCHTHPWTAELFQRELANPVSSIDLLWLGDTLAGYLCSWLVGGELEILNVATHPDCRRRGVAARLMAHTLERARREGLEAAYLEVRVGNAGAIDLYCKIGFRVVSRRSRYYADGEDALVMAWREG
jgi:ribosomal-protein-alanine N-acetyltransferase